MISRTDVTIALIDGCISRAVSQETPRVIYHPRLLVHHVTVLENDKCSGFCTLIRPSERPSRTWHLEVSHVQQCELPCNPQLHL